MSLNFYDKLFDDVDETWEDPTSFGLPIKDYFIKFT
jgi:hypothetical protein